MINNRSYDSNAQYMNTFNEIDLNEKDFEISIAILILKNYV